MSDFRVIAVEGAEHFDIHRHENRFAAWPYNGGVWKYPGDEIVVGFASRTCHYDPERPYEVAHPYNPGDGVGGKILARSTDGGQSWEERIFEETKDLEWKFRHANPIPCEELVDFRNPDLFIAHYGPFVLISTDRGKTIIKADELPKARNAPNTPYDRVKIMGRPDYVIRPDGACILLTTISSPTGVEGRPAAYISRNGALSWERLALIGEEPEHYMRIMPSGLWLPSGKMIVAVRSQLEGHGTSFWAEVFESDDGGQSWQYLSRVNDLGAPCHILLLDDGRVLATYGYRSPPYGIRARVSEDGGRTWGPELVLRDDGKSWDLGYPKSVQLDNGEVVSIYYHNRQDDTVDVNGGVRHIAGTRWNVK